MANTDILLDNDGDLLVVNGDFSFGLSDLQHVVLIFEAHKGEIRENPMLGFGANAYLKTIKSNLEIKRDLRVELQRDGYKDVDLEIDLTTGKLNIELL
jgi:hypothetical protein